MDDYPARGGRRDVGEPGAGTTATALFEIARSGPMRAFVEVPQAFAPSVHAGAEAKVAVRNSAGASSPGVSSGPPVRSNPASRTLRTEVDLPNRRTSSSRDGTGVSLDVELSIRWSGCRSSAVVADSRVCTSRS